MQSALRPLIVSLFTLVVCAVFVVHYLITGKLIFHLNSVGASPILFLKINYDQFHSLNFVPTFWTPLYGAGGPTAVGYATFNPVILAVSWIEPFANALVAYEVLLRGIGTLGCYRLLHRNGLGLAPSLAGAGLFAFNVFSSSAGQDPQLGLPVLLLPWAVIALQAIIERPSWMPTCGLSGILALFYLISTTQIFGFTIFILFIPLTLSMWACFAPAGAGRMSLAGHSLSPFGWIAIGAIACLALVAFDLASQVENLSVSLTSLNVSSATRDYFLIAPVAVLIAVGVSAAFCANSPAWRVAAALATLMGIGSVYRVLQLSVGSIVSANFGYVSIDAFVFAQQRCRFFLTLLGTMLLLYGLASLVRHGSERRGLLAIIAVGAAFGLVPLFVTPSDYYDRFVFVPMIAVSVLVGIGASQLLKRVQRSVSQSYWVVASGALVILVTTEGVNMTIRQTIYTDALKYTMTTTLEMASLARLGPAARVIDTYENEHTEWVRQLPVLRQSLLRWLIPCYAGVQTFSRVGVSFVPDGFNTFYKAALPDAYFGIKPGQWSPLLNLAGVTHLLSREAPGDGFVLETKGTDYTISRNPKAMPRVQIYGSVHVTNDQTALLDLEKSAASGNLRTATLAPEHGSALRALDQWTTGIATVASYADEKVTIRANLRGQSFLVLADTYHPGWMAFIDGVPAPVLRANVAFRGVFVEPGEHEIEFRFAPDYRFPLLALAVVALLVHAITALAALARLLRR